jgi:Curli production assembly/transport component CsgG
MKTRLRVVSIVICIGGLFLATANGAETAAGPPVAKAGEPGAQTPVKTSFEVTNGYTAQRRPRVTVLVLEDTNQKEEKTLYGSSVEAMLVTFLKRKSQFVVVERQKLDRLMIEKKRLQFGQVQISSDDKESQTLLEKIDVFVLGSVTLLDFAPLPDLEEDEGEAGSASAAEAGADPDMGGEELDEEGEDFAQSESDKNRAKKLDSIPGQRIEIDLKLISRFDGRIIAAAQRSGPLACLRSIVERLGVALEQEFLRPYHGKLTVRLNEPEHIRVFLTPILPEDALNEEKPPVERSTTVTIGSGYDTVETWTTDPTTYTIKNLLSGWYSMRIERPGYESIGVENSRWEVRKRLGKEVVYDRKANVPFDKADPALSRFVVQVDPLDTLVVDGNTRGFKLTKQGGSLAPLVKRQYLDTDFSRPPQRVILMGGRRIELNQLRPPAEYADDEKCDLFEERKPLHANDGRTYVTANQSFDFDSFTGGELIIEDYKGEVVPVGVYQMALWEPSYQTEEPKVRVRAGDDKKPVKVPLTRETAGLSLMATGLRPTSQVFLEGRETRLRVDLSLNFEKPKELRALPVDSYLTTTNVTGLDGWQRSAVVPALNLTPPKFDTKSPRHQLSLINPPRPTVDLVPSAGVKTHFGIAGRLETLSQIPDPLSADLFIDKSFPVILNLLLYGVPRRPGDVRSDFTTAAAEAGRETPAPTTVTKVSLSPTSGSPAKTPSDTGDGKDASPKAAEETASSQEIAADPDGPYVLEERTSLTPAQLLRNQDFLRSLLAERLEYLDLVVLDPVDMVQLRKSPEVAAIFARYVASGGSLFAYISSVGNYRQVIGAPLAIEKLSKRTRRLDLAPGEVDGLIPQLSRKEVKVKSKRAVPEVADLSAPWRILAYTRSGRRPRIIERGGQVEGGYVALWLDDPQAFRSRWGGTRPKVEETRGRVEDHVMQQARALMRRRFDRSSQALQPCTPPPTPPSP